MGVELEKGGVQLDLGRDDVQLDLGADDMKGSQRVAGRELQECFLPRPQKFSVEHDKTIRELSPTRES